LVFDVDVVASAARELAEATLKAVDRMVGGQART
jgi:hypothetical protein